MTRPRLGTYRTLTLIFQQKERGLKEKGRSGLGNYAPVLQSKNNANH